MGRAKKQITSIEENAKLLTKIDSHRKDRTITITEFKKLTSNDLEEILDQPPVEWNEFKHIFIDTQGELGFSWSYSQGYAGPIRLESITLRPELGSEIAMKLHKEKIPNGNFYDILKKHLPNLYNYLDDDDNLLDINYAREEFKIPDPNSGYGFKFKPNSTRFERKLLEYKYQSETGKHEIELGTKIIKPLKDEFKFDFAYHTQEEREGQKYKNIDIEGLKIIRTESEDFFEIYAFELKATNSIQSISEAISQAINYKVCSNYTYILIPNFDFENFYDETRLREYLEMCRQNQIGIISLEMKGNELKELNILIEASKTHLNDYTRIISLSKKKEFQYEKCHLCGKIVHKEHRSQCGWAVSLEEEEGAHCMKLLQQEQIELFLHSRNVDTNLNTTLITKKTGS